VQPIGLDVKVWGPVEDRDGMLQRVDALKRAIKATGPLLLEQGVVVVEEMQGGFRVITYVQAIFSSLAMRDSVASELKDLTNHIKGKPRPKAKWEEWSPEAILDIK
jgi:hypothetical protein